MNIKKYIEEHKQGFSLGLNEENGQLEEQEFKNGYSVALTDNETSLKDCESDLIKLLKLSTMLNVSDDKVIIGGWFDFATKKYYLDFSVWVEHLSEALTIAKLFNQKAIWDFGLKEEILTNDL